jgi:hypothetical protein
MHFIVISCDNNEVLIGDVPLGAALHIPIA